MLLVVMLLAVLMPILVSAAIILGRHLQRQHQADEELSAVSRQHLELFQGGHLSEAAVESAKERLRGLLERGDFAAIEASLQPGTQFVVQVRALAEIGTDDAGRILERQLDRRLSNNKIEQSWYWIDLANCLRSLNREQSLPLLLHCVEAAGDIPLRHFLAAETVCFLGFAGYLAEDDSFLRHAAYRVLHQALEGLRCGVPPHVIAEGRLGEAIECLWDNRPEQVHPLVARIFVEALRLLRRAEHVEHFLDSEQVEQEAFRWQLSRLAALEAVLEDYLEECPSLLAMELAQALPARQDDILLALNDLRADVGADLLPLLSHPQLIDVELAVQVLTWSRDACVAEYLRTWAAQSVPMDRRALRRPRPLSPRRSTIPADVPYQAILRALRGHPAPRTEEFLMLAAQDFDPLYRAAALSSLGWWEPFHRVEVLWCLQKGRRDINLEVRQAARAALARLGECQALHWFRQALFSDESQRVHEVLQVIADEELVFLWPDLDHLADAGDMDIAQHAREVLERLRERMNFPCV
ncbi:MAG: hypothetical protein ACK4RK_06840 [Gemmataceae bacterium]